MLSTSLATNPSAAAGSPMRCSRRSAAAPVAAVRGAAAPAAVRPLAADPAAPVPERVRPRVRRLVVFDGRLA
jgi:hypothetical protein